VSTIARPNPVSRLVDAGDGLAINVFPEASSCVVHVSGELDLATSDTLFIASSACNHPSMVIDLGGLTFMDCGGYRCLVACRLAIGGRGGTLVIRGQTGQPARLLDLIRGLEAR